MNWTKFKDGELYRIVVACSSEGEYSDEVSEPFLAKFHRVIGDFEDEKGNVSHHPIEWFESLVFHYHYSCDIVSAKKVIEKPS